MNLKNEKGSITIFVLVGLLFMSAFLIILYGSNVNKSKVVHEQSNIIESLYMKNENTVDGYTDAYTALRKKNKQILTATVEDSNTVELTKTFAENLSDYKIYGHVTYINQRLPEEYQEIEYIESTGTQYIDTNLYGSIDIKVDIDIEIVNKTNSSIIGTDNYKWSTEYVCQAYNNSLYVFKSKNIIDLGDNTRMKIHLDPKEQSTIENIGSVNSGMTEIANTKIYIAKWGSYLGKFKLYSCKFYENEVLVRDFIPCFRKSDDVAGLYDMVNNIFYTNSGTGNFKKGDMVGEEIKLGDLVTDTNDSNFGKYKIPIKVTNENGYSENYNIYLTTTLGTEDYIDFKNGKIVKEGSIKEDIELPEIFAFDDYTKIEVLTEEIPTKIVIDYYGYEYTQLEYIELTGTQYIDTKIYGNINIKTDIDISVINKNNVSVIGTDNYSWTNQYAIQLYNNNFYAFKVENTKPIGNSTRLKMHLDPIGESSITGIGSVNSEVTAIANTKIYIAKWGSYLGAFKLYSCKFYENDIIIRDFVPAKNSDGEIGLYDKVTKEFYKNAGTGEFIAGPEV